MLLILALIECGLVGAAVGAAIHLGSGPPIAGSGHHGIALGLSLGFSLSCAVALSYQQLYDRRAVRTIRGFLSRMSVAAGLPFLLALALWKVIEPAEIDPLYPLVILAALLATLLMLRAVVYLVEVLHPFARRNLCWAPARWPCRSSRSSRRRPAHARSSSGS